MRSFVLKVLVNSLSLYLLSQIFTGLKITGGFPSLFLGGFALTILLIIIKPLINLLTLPINILTLGFFSIIIQTIIYALTLYGLTLFVKEIMITDFTFQGTNLYGFIIPKIYFSTFFAYAFLGFILSLINSFIFWMIDR